MRKILVTAAGAFAVASGFVLAAPAPEAQAVPFPCPPGVVGMNCLSDGSNGRVTACTLGFFWSGCYNNLQRLWLQDPDGNWYPA